MTEERLKEIKMQKELCDIKLKDEILNKMFLNLSKESLMDILEILKGYKTRLNKTKKDTLLSRCMFAYGYHNTLEFQEILHTTKDDTRIKALSNDVFNIKTIDTLRKAFNIDDNTFVRIIKEIGGTNDRRKIKRN